MPSMSFVKDEVQNLEIQLKAEKLAELSKKSGISMTHLALGWCALNPNVSTVILGASRLEQLKENLSVVGKMNHIADLKKELDLI